MNALRILLIVFTCCFFYSCNPSSNAIELNVKNNLSTERINETIEIDLLRIPNLLSIYKPQQLLVKDGSNDQILLSQLIDVDGDNSPDQLIFQTDFQPNEHKHFHIEGAAEDIQMPESSISTYARFVPERIDDFAWENDKVAFRTYGPKAQAITESGKPGGTLSSGIDCWLKRVDYPIIDKWYKQDLEEGKSYHKDHGEGLDNYHVGASRGTGGIGIWKDDKLHFSKNFQNWKLVANGPIRTIFELDYETWDADGLQVKEIKRISIDLGSNLFRNTLLLGNYNDLPNVALGITLHEKMGEVKVDAEKGWFRYLEPHDGSELSTAIVVDPSHIKEWIDYRAEEKDLSNLLVVCESSPELTYYAGFAWAKSNQFDSMTDFDDYLEDFANRLASPLIVEILE